MLLRPPFIQQDDVKSQNSNTISQNQRQKSVKSTSKNKKKQNSLGMRKPNVMAMQYNVANNIENQNYDSDNGSVHSVNSRKSKGKTKQSTITIGKKQNQYQNMNQNSAYSIKNQNQKDDYQIFKLDSDDDNKSIGSHASKNSKKNKVKENTLGKNKNQKVNVQLNYYYNQKEEDPSPRNYYMEEESKVQTVRLNENVQPFTQPIKYNQALKGAPLTKNPQSRRRTEQPINKHTSSPFQQITLKRQQVEEEPVYRLKEPQENRYNKNANTNLFGQNVNNRPTQQANPFVQKNVFQQNNKSQAQIQLQARKIKVDLQQSSTIQPQMISTKSVTKSRRNKIFDNDNNSISNSSNIMNSQTNMQGSFERSKSKSKSKLGGLLKQSRDKKQLQNSREKDDSVKPARVLSPVQNRYLPVQTKPQQVQNRRQFNPSRGQITQKRPQLAQNKIQTNIKKQIQQTTNILSQIQKSSNEQKRIGGQRLAENTIKMEQIKRKSIENEFFDLGQSQLDLNLSMSHKVPDPSVLKGDSLYFNFQPEKKKGISILSKEKPSNAENKSLQSKKHLDRLMKKCQQNEEFLAKSILSNNSQLRQSKKPNMNFIPSPNLNKKQETLTRPFDRIKAQQIEEEPAWHGIVKNDPVFQIKQVQRKQIRRPSEEQIRVNNANSPQQSKPVSPSEFFQIMKQTQQNINNRSEQQQFYGNTNLKQQTQNKELINQVEQKNRILAQIQKRAKTDQQKQTIKNTPIHNPFPVYAQEREMPTNPLNRQRQKKKPVVIDQQIEQRENRLIKEQAQRSSLSHELSLSQNGSQRSNSHSAKKQKKKQSSLNIMKKHKVQVRQQQPRAEQSFYEERPQQPPKQLSEPTQSLRAEQTDRTFKMEQSRNNIQYKKPNVINFPESDTQQQRVKSKTDMNFYNYGQASQKSIRPPSSKPPLSRKSGCSSSKSKSKAKQSTLHINVVKKQNKMLKNTAQGNQKQEPKKKKTLLEIANDKDYEGSGYGGSDSQCSFNSRESFGSVNSRGSRKSSGSRKQSTLPITIKNKTSTMNNYRPSLNKITSTTSEVQIYENQNQSIYNQLQQQSVKKISRERQRQNYPNHQKQRQREQRTIVSKDTYFIDEKGRLVKQDLVIRGNQVYGQTSNKNVEQMAYDRMKRSRDHHRSRSKSRDGSGSRLSKKNSTSALQQSEYNTGSSSNYFNGSASNGGQYGNQGGQYGNPRQNLYIDEFIKPVEEPMMSAKPNYKFQKPANQRKIQNQFYQNEEQPYQSYYHQQDEQPVKSITLNQLFGRKPKEPNTNSRAPKQNVYQNKNEQSKYGGNSRFNGQESRQSGRKKSLSRTEKTFYNK